MFTGLYGILGEPLRDRCASAIAGRRCKRLHFAACAVRRKVKDSVVLADLTKVQFPATFRADIVKAYTAKYVPKGATRHCSRPGHRRREALEAAADKRRVTLPSISGVNWRVRFCWSSRFLGVGSSDDGRAWQVDITISTTAMARVFKPSVTLQLTLSDGRIRTFECRQACLWPARSRTNFVDCCCSLKQFHELRYNVAKVLKDMLDLSEHPTLVRNLDS